MHNIDELYYDNRSNDDVVASLDNNSFNNKKSNESNQNRNIKWILIIRKSKFIFWIC